MGDAIHRSLLPCPSSLFTRHWSPCHPEPARRRRARSPWLRTGVRDLLLPLLFAVDSSLVTDHRSPITALVTCHSSPVTAFVFSNPVAVNGEVAAATEGSASAVCPRR